MYRITLLLALTVLLSGGCSTTPQIQNDPELQALREQSAADPEDIYKVGQLADANLARYLKTHDQAYGNQALGHYRMFLRVHPDHPGANLALYQILSIMVIIDGNDAALSELYEIYSRVSVLRESKLLPPSLVAAIHKSNTTPLSEGLPEIKTLLNQAIRENPNHAESRIRLSLLFLIEEKYDLAIAMAKQATVAEPDNLRALNALASAHFDKARANMCQASNPDTAKALKLLKQVVVKSPDDADAHASLARLYELRGQYEMMLFEARQHQRLHDSVITRNYVASALVHLGRRDQSEKLYNDSLQNFQYPEETLRGLGVLYFIDGQWQKAADALDKYLALQNQPQFYETLKRSLSAHQLGNHKMAERLVQEFPLSATGNDWERTLLAYHKKEIESKELLSRAENICEQTEAHFYVGFQHWLAGEREKVVMEFERVRALKVYGFVEHNASRTALTKLSQLGMQARVE